MAYYQKLERPVANESEAVQLKFGLTLQQIMDVVRIAIVLNFLGNLSPSGREKPNYDDKCLAKFGKHDMKKIPTNISGFSHL